MNENCPKSAKWPRYIMFALGAFVLLNALAAWFHWLDYQSSLPIARPSTVNDFVFPIVLSSLGIGIVLAAIRTSLSGKRNLVITILATVAVFVGLNLYANWYQHRNDFGNPDDLSKPWQHGSVEFKPAEPP